MDNPANGVATIRKAGQFSLRRGSVFVSPKGQFLMSLDKLHATSGIRHDREAPNEMGDVHSVSIRPTTTESAVFGAEPVQADFT